MKTKLIIFLLAICGIANAQITFEKNYGTNQGDWASKIIQQSNGEYVLTGVTNGYGAGGDIFLLKIDTVGNIKWIKNLFGVNTDNPYDMIMNNDGGFSIVGSTGSFGVGNTDGIFITTDSLASVLRTTTYGTSSDYDELHSIQKTNNGYILGGTNAWSFVGPEIYKVDSMGNKIWSFVLSTGTNADILKSIYQTNDNNLIILRSTNPSYGNSFAIIKLGYNGNFIWAKQYATTNSNNQMSASKMKHTNDNGYIVTGYIEQNGGGSANIFLLKTDSMGNKKWFKTYGGVFQEYGNDVIETSDNGYAVTGSTNSFGFGSNDAFILKTDSLGTFKWAKTYGDAWENKAVSIIQTLDGGFACVGNTTLNGTNVDSLNILFIKTDAYGNSNCKDTIWSPDVTNAVYGLTSVNYSLIPYGVTTFPTVISHSKNFSTRNFCPQTGIEEFKLLKSNISIFPNPFYSITTLESETVLDNAKLIIYNSFGQEVQVVEKIKGNKIILHRDNLSSGIYFLRLFQDQNAIAACKLIITNN